MEKTVDKTPRAGRRIHCEPSTLSETETVKVYKIPCDENGQPIGYTVEEVFAKVNRNLSEVYGVDFAKLSKLVNSGELSLDEVTEDMLFSPEFKYEPYPDFKPKPLPTGFTPDINTLSAL